MSAITPLSAGPSDSLGKYRAAVIAAGVLWSLGGVFIKALTQHPAWQPTALGITFYRSLFAFICLVPLLRGRVLPRARDILPAAIIYTLLLGLYVASTQGTSAANAIFLQYTAPLYALVLGPWFFGEAVRRSDVWALTIAMSGVAVLFIGSFQGSEQWPLVMGAGSGLMFGLFLLWLRRMRDADPIAVTALNNGGVAVLAALVLALAGSSDLDVPVALVSGNTGLLPVVGLVALMGCLQIAVPYVLFSYGLRRVPAVEASLLALVEPILNPLWVVLFIHEAPSPATLVGGSLIVAGLVCRYTLFRPAPENAP